MSWLSETGNLLASLGAPRMTSEALIANMLTDIGVAGSYVLLLYIVVYLNRQKHVTIFVPRNSYVFAFFAILAPSLAASLAGLAMPGAAVHLAYKAFVVAMLVAVVIGIWRVLPREVDPWEQRKMQIENLALQAAVAERQHAESRLHELKSGFESRISTRTAELTAVNLALEKEIIERKLAEERAAEGKRRLDELIMRTNTATVLIDGDMTVLDGNHALARVLGRATVDELLGRELSKLLGLKNDATLRHFCNETLRLGTFAYEFEATPPARGTVSVEANGAASVLNNRPCIMALFRDVSERKAAEKELMQSREALSAALDVARQANATKSVFLAKMNHELRTPLNGIIGLSEILRHKATAASIKGADIRKLCNNIHQSGSHLLSLVDDLLDLSRLDAGSRPFHPTNVAVRAEIDSALVTLGSIADQKRIVVENTCPADFEWVVDQRAFKQIIINLVNNAVKFSPPDSQVRISVTRSTEAMALHIADQGTGICEEERERILTPFGRGRYAEDHKIDGVGLGLTIVSELLKLQGGKLAIESKSGEGSTFTAIFPLGVGQEPPMQVAAE